MDQAYQSDFPVTKQLKYTLGDPTFHAWKWALEIKEPRYPTRNRGQSKGYLLGGIHLTYYTYMPYFMLRMLSATECSQWTKKDLRTWFIEPLSNYTDTHSLEGMEDLVQKRKKHKKLKLIKEVNEDLSDITECLLKRSYPDK